MRLLIATRSAGKTREVKELFTGLPFELVFPESAGLPRVPEEDGIERGTTYVENAVAKARYFVERAGPPRSTTTPSCRGTSLSAPVCPPVPTIRGWK